MTDPSPKEWQEILTGEMLLLRLISRILYVYPGSDQRPWLQSLIDEGVFAEVPFAAENEETKTGLRLLQEWNRAGLIDTVFENMQADYMRLFIGPDKALASPWESVHFGDDRLLFQERTLDVRNWYRRFGLQVEKIQQEPEDHIGLELLFLSHLAMLGITAQNDEEQEHLGETLDAQRDFLRQHPGTWGLTWCKSVEENAHTNFYLGLAHLTRGALETLADVLGVALVKEVKR